MNKHKEYREYLIENIRVSRNEFNRLNDDRYDWEELGYSDEVAFEGDVARAGGIFHSLECALHLFDKLFDIDDTEDRLSFANVEDAYDYYWDQSRNPNGNYETEIALDEGELPFCEKMGFSIDEWIKCGHRKNK
jgi:hypothetical protein